MSVAVALAGLTAVSNSGLFGGGDDERTPKPRRGHRGVRRRYEESLGIRAKPLKQGGAGGPASRALTAQEEAILAAGWRPGQPVGSVPARGSIPAASSGPQGTKGGATLDQALGALGAFLDTVGGSADDTATTTPGARPGTGGILGGMSPLWIVAIVIVGFLLLRRG